MLVKREKKLVMSWFNVFVLKALGMFYEVVTADEKEKKKLHVLNVLKM